MAFCDIVFNSWMLCGDNMALLMKDSYILYYYTDAIRSTLLGHSYFISPEYLAVKTWVCATFLFPDIIVFIGHACIDRKFLPRCDRLFFYGLSCHHLEAIFILIILLQLHLTLFDSLMLHVFNNFNNAHHNSITPGTNKASML